MELVDLERSPLSKVGGLEKNVALKEQVQKKSMLLTFRSELRQRQRTGSKSN